MTNEAEAADVLAEMERTLATNLKACEIPAREWVRIAHRLLGQWLLNASAGHPASIGTLDLIAASTTIVWPEGPADRDEVIAAIANTPFAEEAVLGKYYGSTVLKALESAGYSVMKRQGTVAP